MKVLLAVGGGIAAYKAAELARLLMQQGHQVQAVMTAAAEEFVRPLTFAALTDGQLMQIDLQEPMTIKAITWHKKPVTYTREGNAFHVKFPKPIKAGSIETLDISYSGVPKVAVRPPWRLLCARHPSVRATPDHPSPGAHSLASRQ